MLTTLQPFNPTVAWRQCSVFYSSGNFFNLTCEFRQLKVKLKCWA